METEMEDPIAEYIVEFLAGFWVFDPPILEVAVPDAVEEDDEDSDFYANAYGSTDYESLSPSSSHRYHGYHGSIGSLWSMSSPTSQSLLSDDDVHDPDLDLEPSPSVSTSSAPDYNDDDPDLIDPPDCTTVAQLVEKMRFTFMLKLYRLRDFRDIIMNAILDNGLGIFRNIEVVNIPQTPPEEIQSQTTDQFYLENMMKNLLAFEGILMNIWSLGDECASCLQFIKFCKGIDTPRDRSTFGHMDILSQIVRQGVFKSFFHISNVKYELDHSKISPTFRFIICFHKLISSMDFLDEWVGKLLDHYNTVIHKENKYTLKMNVNSKYGSALCSASALP